MFIESTITIELCINALLFQLLCRLFALRLLLLQLHLVNGRLQIGEAIVASRLLLLQLDVGVLRQLRLGELTRCTVRIELGCTKLNMVGVVYARWSQYTQQQKSTKNKCDTTNLTTSQIPNHEDVIDALICVSAVTVLYVMMRGCSAMEFVIQRI